MKPPDSLMAAFLAGTGATMRTVGSVRARAFIGRLPRHCTWCGEQVPKGRVTWCGDASCLDQWEERTDPRRQQRLVRHRDNEVCQLCRLDTKRVARLLTKLWAASRRTPTPHTLGRYKRANALLKDRSLWESDHIVPVCEGGGLCTIENLRTLCLPCHKSETKTLRSRRKKGSSPCKKSPVAEAGKKNLLDNS